jgi:hypothetical protein
MSSQPKRTSSADRRPANAPSARTGMSSGGAGKEQLLEALRTGKTSLLISPRHDEARKVAALVRQKLKAEGAIGAEDHAVTVLRRMDFGPEACRDPLHYAAGRVVGFHIRTAGGFRPGEKWTVRKTNCETVTLERSAEVRQFRPSARG